MKIASHVVMQAASLLRLRFGRLATVASLLLGTSLAHAACIAPLSVEDFYYRGSPADDCTGVLPGNDNEGNVAGLFGSDWTRLVKFDADQSATVGETYWGTSPFLVPGGSITFGLKYLGLLGGYYEYELLASGNPETLLPATIDLMGVIKQGNDFAGYLFSGALIDSTGNLGRFRSEFGPGTNQFSHFSFYGANYGRPNGGGDVSAPGTLALAALGLLLLSRRRAA